METQVMMNAEPQKEHRWLQKLVGEWTYESEAVMEPGKPPEKCGGTETVRSVGGLWIVAEGRGQMPGGEPATMVMTLGYDPEKKRFCGTWIGSMMTHLWVYDGALDAGGTVLALEADGPSMAADGKLARYCDAIELKSDDLRILKSSVRGDDGSWKPFMTATYRRTQ
jgi:hypothetical protein